MQGISRRRHLSYRGQLRLRLIVRKQPIEPSANQVSAVRPPRQSVFRRLVDGEHVTFDAEEQDLVLTGVQQRSHPVLALAQCALGLLALSDILRNQHGAGDPAIDLQRRVGAGDGNR